MSTVGTDPVAGDDSPDVVDVRSNRPDERTASNPAIVGGLRAAFSHLSDGVPRPITMGAERSDE